MSDEIRRYREFTRRGPTAHVIAYRNDTGPLATQRDVDMTVFEDQTTWSRDTPFPWAQRVQRRTLASGRRSRSREIAADFGAPFTTIRRTYDDDGGLNRIISLPEVSWVGNRYGFHGPLLGMNPGAKGPFGYYPTFDEPALSKEMQQRGTTAIARTIPTNPSVGVGQLIGESIERLPALPGAALLGRPGNVSKKFADEYLNYEFGLKPLISDIDGIVRTVRDTNKILAQLERDSGRLVRRRYSFPVERTIEPMNGTGESQNYISHPTLATRQYSGPGLYTHRRVTEKRMWFSGAYTYHYSQGSDLWSRLKRAEQEGNRLFGLRFSPSLAWELAPWSWAADWVSNAGDVITNLSAFSRDGLVLKWGYVMCDLKITDIHTRRINLVNYGFVRSEQRFTTHVKKRIRATPYGFGLDPDWKDFSSRQLAILGALGISRGR